MQTHAFSLLVFSLQIASIQRAAGLESVLVDPLARDGSTVTVTGWVALACIISLIVVIIGGAFMVRVRRG